MILAAACLTPSVAFSTQQAFPSDFDQPTEVIGGAGGSDTRERDTLRHLPVILIADNQRIHTDWLGANCGNAEGSVYQAFIDQEFTPFELWMLDLVPAEGYQLTSLELRTDNLKEMIFAVLQYTGANQVNILAHGAGAVLAQATLIKYNLFYAVHSAAYIAGPFHGTYACGYEQCLEGLPLCCNLTPGSDFLQDVLLPNETPFDPQTSTDTRWTTRYLTVRNGRRFADTWFLRNPESPSLDGATNLSFPLLSHDGLRCSSEVLARVIPFLMVPTTPYEARHDLDGDGFQDRDWDGPDCRDQNPSIFPGAAEVCEDGIDQDCNAVDISCKGGKDRDIPRSRLPYLEPNNKPKPAPTTDVVEETGVHSADKAGLFFVDVLPERGIATYTIRKTIGGLAAFDDHTYEILTEDMGFPHNVEPWRDLLLVTDTETHSVNLVDPTGKIIDVYHSIIWLDGKKRPLERVNWILPVARIEVEQFLGRDFPDVPYFLLCCRRTVGDKKSGWWTISVLEEGIFRSIWEMKVGRGKAHAALLHHGTLYGAASQARELIVKSTDLDFLVPVGDIRYMELENERLWMACDGFVAVYDSLPQSPADQPRVFCSGIGRAQAVHIWENRVYIVANGMIMIFSMKGELLSTVGEPAPEPGLSLLHDQLRALGYLS